MTTNLIYLVLGIVILVIVVLIISVIPKSPSVQVPSDVASKHRRYLKGRKTGEFSLKDIVQIRILESVEQSIDYVREFKEYLIETMAAEDTASGFSSIEASQETYNLLEKYEEFCEKSSGFSYDEIASNIAELNGLFKPDEEMPIYGFLVGLAKSISMGKFLLIHRTLVSFCNKFNQQSANSPPGRALLEVIVRICCHANSSSQAIESKHDKKGRQEAVRSCRGCLQESFSRVRQVYARLESEQQYPLVELKLLNHYISQIQDIVHKEQIDIADKPHFVVKVDFNDDVYVVEGDYFDLSFNIENINHSVANVKESSLLPVSVSNDVVYEGEPLTIKFEKAQSQAHIEFRSYIFNKETCTQTHQVVFRFVTRIHQHEYKQEFSVDLPPLEPRHRVVNPFKEGEAGRALPAGSRLFVGRKEEMAGIVRDLLNFESYPSFYSVVGESRSGKTSVLNQLGGNPRFLKGLYIPIWLSAELVNDLNLFFDDLYKQLIQKMEFDLGVHVKCKKDKTKLSHNEQAFTRVLELLRVNEQFIKDTRKRFLLLIDEYQQFTGWDEASTKPKHPVTSHTVPYVLPEFIKVLSDQYRETVVVVMAGRQDLKGVSLQNAKWIQDLGGRITELEIGMLNDKEANTLIKRNIDSSEVELSEEVLELARTYTNCHPFLHMKLGYFIFEELLIDEEYRDDRKVTIEDVHRAASKIKILDMKFIWIEPWIAIDTNARILLCGVAEYSYEYAVDRGDIVKMPEVTLEEIEDWMAIKYKVPRHYLEFSGSVMKLVDHHVFLQSGDQQKYRLQYPVFAIAAKRENALSRLLESLMKG